MGDDAPAPSTRRQFIAGSFITRASPPEAHAQVAPTANLLLTPDGVRHLNG
ncbi:hypothetical protein AZA_64924 [Nitrospirillum viridazoti Y2]|nr:hypothetical protein AZA_64924 [Nitrospirillum amazonense Y2]